MGNGFSEKHGERYDALPPDTVCRLLTNPQQGSVRRRSESARDTLLLDALRGGAQGTRAASGARPFAVVVGQSSTRCASATLSIEQPGASELLDLGPLPRPGDEYTVNATGFDESWASWEQIEGASYREILDTSDWDQSVAVNTPGQSGQPS